ncbi:MAG: glycerol kinase, partial [Clostridiaceae bacterium]|nr:glycerol kinase [Clostridiaceae bacterium]
EGSIFVAGAAVQWLRDEMHLIKTAEESEVLALQVEDTQGCYVVPAFTGLGAPYWDQYARGTIVGLTRGVNNRHLVRATLESIAYQVEDVLQVMQEDSGIQLRALKADGGAANNNFLMQFQADLTGVSVMRPACVETTALGAAYLAGLATGFWPDIGALERNWKMDRVFEPAMSDADRQRKLAGWRKAVPRSFGWEA